MGEDEALWHMAHADGDEEDLNERELSPLLLPTAARQQLRFAPPLQALRDRVEMLHAEERAAPSWRSRRTRRTTDPSPSA